MKEGGKTSEKEGKRKLKIGITKCTAYYSNSESEVKGERVESNKREERREG